MVSVENKIFYQYDPAGIYLLKVNNRNSRIRCEICSELTINTPELRDWCRCGVFIANFVPCSSVFIVNFEHVITSKCEVI